jgi:hypothetical protein
MQGLFTIDKTKSEENATKIMKVLPKQPSLVMPVWGTKVVEKTKLVGLHWVKYYETTQHKYF